MAQSEEFTSFKDYKDRITGANIDTRSRAEIMAELDEVEKLFIKPEKEETPDGT